MRLLLRSLFVWLMALALALPLQGIAVAGMQACGPTHGHTAPVAASAHDAGHGHADAHSVHGDVHGEAHAPAVEHPSTDTERPAAGHQCGACAACGSAVALPSVLVLPAAPASAAVEIPAAPGRLASFVPPGLERPPRAILA